MEYSEQTIMTDLAAHGRLDRFNALLERILPANPFQCARLGDQRRCDSVEDFLALPLLTKEALVADFADHPPFGTNLTYPPESYTRYHQTSGTTGAPLRILDDERSWDWWGRCWLEVYKAARVTAQDRLFFAFSFAPSIGFWTALKGAEMLGSLVIAGGGATSLQRLRMILDTEATVILCTPTYALHLAEVAQNEDIPIRESNVQVLIHAGEPGASLPNTRRRIEEAWGARVLDHSGATEVGAWGVGCPQGRGVYVNEEEFIAEVLDEATGEPVATGETGELVLTALGRTSWPVIRYRSGDTVRAVREVDADGTSKLLLEGGILGRTDDMVTIRAVNVFPSAIENLVRKITDTAEFRITATRREEMDNLSIELEGDAELCRQAENHIRQQLGIRVDVKSVPLETLPRWQAKHKRFVDLRSSE